jgi:sigma-B regulation protein RsbU (phosphoserine phosphatase)
MTAGGFSFAGAGDGQDLFIGERTLASMNTEDLLYALLDQVREALAAEIAAVLLLERDSRQLAMTAARGIEEEIFQGVKVPVGKGVAGRIAASRRPLIIENLTPADLVNPALLQRGIRSMLGVPILDDAGVLVGVLAIGTLSTRRFTDGEVRYLQDAANRAATVLPTLRSLGEREAARELQRSLLPSKLPAVPGVELAARYSPGREDVGGDWYDVFTLPSGEVCVVMGDVAGHGLRAATTMGRMRSALRAYALESSDPAGVLRRLDRLMQHFEPDVTATVLYALCHPSLEWVRASSAGHLPPVLASPGRGAAPLNIPPDPLIGSDARRPRVATTLEIPAGALLCLYTDGLVERRDRPIDAGLAKLYESVFPGPPDEVCGAVMAALIGREPVEDDVAILALRRESGTRTGGRHP